MDFNLFSSGQNNSIFDRDEVNSKTRVRSVSLDTHLSQLDHVDVVKIDVEGAEPLVLQGMKGMIANNPAMKIILEFAPSNVERGGTDPCDFINFIRSMGLDIHVIEENSGGILSVSDEDLCRGFSVNLLLEKK